MTRLPAFGVACLALMMSLGWLGSASGAPRPTEGLSRFATVPVSVPSANAAPPFDQPRTLTLPAGWTAEVWARVAGARFALWAPNGQLLVSVPGAGQVIALRPGRSAAAVPRETVLLSGLTNPQGLAFDLLHGQRVLYVAESNEIVRYVWRANGTPGPRTVVVPELPDTDADGDDVHRLKEIAVGADHALYVDIGSSSNVDTGDLNATPPRGVVMAYQPDGTGRVYATGIRNGDGLSFDPTGALWAAVNNRDQIPYPFHESYGNVPDAYGTVITAYVNDHPPDELAKLGQGRNLGWPYCNPDPDVSPGAASSALHYATLPFDPDAEMNPGGTVFNCAALAPLDRGIPAHSAPLGFHFLEGTRLPASLQDGAVVAAHGSWDRDPPRAPAVLWFPGESAQKTLGPEVTLVSGFQEPDGSRWGRPVDVAPGPDGALYVTDDTAGAVYRLTPPHP